MLLVARKADSGSWRREMIVTWTQLFSWLDFVSFPTRMRFVGKRWIDNGCQKQRHMRGVFLSLIMQMT